MVSVRVLLPFAFALLLMFGTGEAYQCQDVKNFTGYGFACQSHHLESCLKRAQTTYSMKTVQYRSWFVNSLANATNTYIETLKKAKEIYDAKKAIIHKEEARRRCLTEYEELWLRDNCKCGIVRVQSDLSGTTPGKCAFDPESDRGYIRPAYYKWINDSETYAKCRKVVSRKDYCSGCKFSCMASGYTEGPDCENPPF